MNNQNQKNIVIFGSSQPESGSSQYRQAFELGRVLAQAGYRIANGGYGGTMTATAQAAREYGSTTIGVTCKAFGRSGPNHYIDREILTQNLPERLDTLIHLADACVVLPGSTGTLLELATCWELINKRFLKKMPIICLSDYWKPVIDTITRFAETESDFIWFADKPEDVIQLLRDHL